ncbi:hypothetical protein [Bifidobacterium coryneforme]|uniref:hypothetical protein n=1 Tax=Bifidobacterium coryneforme TaxID=1687 RepID=UPI0011DCFC56|nr:hypothetical protein [Bifidobacterium indicum]
MDGVIVYLPRSAPEATEHKALHGISEDSHPLCRICFTLLVDVTVEISLFPRHNFDVAVTSMSRFFEYLSEDKLRHHFIELFCCAF